MDCIEQQWHQVENSVKSEMTKTVDLLKNDQEWPATYHNWITGIEEHLGEVEEAVKMFHIPNGLSVYTCIGKLKDEVKSTKKFSLRYLGQEVALLSINISKHQITLEVSKELAEKDVRDFGLVLGASHQVLLKTGWKVDWGNDVAKELRAYFSEYHKRTDHSNRGNEEHRVESMLLKEFSKTSSSGKQITQIQPVQIGKSHIYFAMSTAVAASDHGTPSLGRGGVDILARTRTPACKGSKSESYLTVIEVKDKNESGEPPEKALQQAGAYAAFLQRLLRGPDGLEWYHLFGFGGDALPKKLTIRIASAMPRSGEKRDLDGVCGCGRCIPIPGLKNGDEVELHTIFFDDCKDRLENLKATFQDHPAP